MPRVDDENAGKFLVDANERGRGGDYVCCDPVAASLSGRAGTFRFSDTDVKAAMEAQVTEEKAQGRQIFRHTREGAKAASLGKAAILKMY